MAKNAHFGAFLSTSYFITNKPVKVEKKSKALNKKLKIFEINLDPSSILSRGHRVGGGGNSPLLTLYTVVTALKSKIW